MQKFMIAKLLLLFISLAELVFHKHVSSIADQDGAKIAALNTDKNRELDHGGKQNLKGMEPGLPSLERAVDASKGNDTNSTKFYELSWVRIAIGLSTH